MREFFRSTTAVHFHYYCRGRRHSHPLHVRIPKNTGHLLLFNYLLLFPISVHIMNGLRRFIIFHEDRRRR